MKPVDVINSHIAKSIERALLGESKLDPEVLKIHGFSTVTMRHLFSNLCDAADAYLEVGAFCGATFVAAFNNNAIEALGIDNFSQPFESEEQFVREQLRDNLNRWKGTAKDVQFLDGDCFRLRPGDEHKLKLHRPFDIFYYDGEHSFENQARALPAFLEVLSDRFIFIVDDYNWTSVRLGTQTGFDVIRPRLKIEKEWTLSGERVSDDPIWWNGLAIFLCSKVEPNFIPDLPPGEND